MAIGSVIGAVIGAGASIIGGSKNKKAINQATAAQQEGNAAALAAQERARAENTALQMPIYNAGLPAIGARNALLGLGGAPAAQPQPQQGMPPQGMPQTIMGPYGPISLPPGVWPQSVTNGGGNGLTYQGPGYQAPVAAQPTQTSAEAASDAFDTFRGSTGYQFRLGEGMNAVNSGYAGAGVIQSGAAMRGAQEYGQNFASNEFGNYMGYLGEQQQLAYGAANALSGVNTNYANNAGNLAISNGQNIANGAVASANNSNAMIGGIAGAAGSVLGGLMPMPGYGNAFTPGYGLGASGGGALGTSSSITGGYRW